MAEMEGFVPHAQKVIISGPLLLFLRHYGPSQVDGLQRVKRPALSAGNGQMTRL